MNDIFGIPMTSVMIVLIGFFALFLLALGWVAWRRPVIFKLGIRNIPRRKAQSALIVIGIMLSTMIITAALGTGDTVYRSITSDVYETLGHVDEVIIASPDVEAQADLTSSQTLPAGTLEQVERLLADNPLVDGIMPMLESRVAARNDSAQLAEPDVVLTGLDPARIDQLGGMQTKTGTPIDFSKLGNDEVIVSEKLAKSIDAQVGDQVTIFIDDSPHQISVNAVAQNSYLNGTRRSYNTSTEYPGLTMTLEGMQSLAGRPGEISAIVVSNAGNAREGLKDSDAVVETLQAELAGSGAGVNAIKSERLDQADQFGTSFTQIFMLLGMFSVISGVLLIVLIFTMLASERRTEMGMARAVGTHRTQLIQQFFAEGAAYALIAGLVGVGLGVLAVYGIAIGMRYIFGEYAPIDAYVTARSLIVAYCLGMVITFVTVMLSSWKISRINIVAAVRDLPEIVVVKRRKSTLIWGIMLSLGGVALILMGSGSNSAPAFSSGMSLMPFGLALILQFLGIPGRAIFSLLGIYLLTLWLIPERTFTDLFGQYEFGLEMFFLAGIFMVIGATLLIVQNTGLLLSAVSAVGGFFRGRLPAVRIGVAFPGAMRSRTGMTIAMFSLIIFSLVMIATMNQNYIESALGDESSAGWDIRAVETGNSPPTDFLSRLQDKDIDIGQFAAVGVIKNPSEHSSAIRMTGTDEWKLWEVKGGDDAFFNHTDFLFSQRATGYENDAAIIDALLNSPNLAVIDAGAIPAEGDIGVEENSLKLTELKSSDAVFDPVTVELQSPLDGLAHEVQIIGIIDSKIGSMSGLYINEETLESIYPSTTLTSWYIALTDTGISDQVAKEIESTLLVNGVQSVSIQDELKDLQKQESGFLYIIEGFMGLGLLVGVAAIGVIAFRSVVERRQQIGVLRAIGFQKELVSFSFMVETMFVVTLGGVTGVGLGLALSRRLVADPDQGFSSEISFVIPWAVILTILAATIIVALIMTWVPSQQASKITPAEALRYE